MMDGVTVTEFIAAIGALVAVVIGAVAKIVIDISKLRKDGPQFPDGWRKEAASAHDKLIDAVSGITRMLDENTAKTDFQAQQTSEIKADIKLMHKEIDERLDNHADRLARLEVKIEATSKMAQDGASQMRQIIDGNLRKENLFERIHDEIRALSNRPRSEMSWPRTGGDD